MDSKVKEFFNFINERHMIWYRRHVLELPQDEWTNDPTLKEFRFCNVYRKLDRGTQYILKKIAHAKSAEVMLAQVIGYRILNNLQAIKEAGGMPIKHKEISPFIHKLREYQQKHNGIWFTAYLTIFPREKAKDNLERYKHALIKIYEEAPRMWREMKECKTPEELIKILQQMPAVGEFIAYEIYCDLAAANVIKFTLNDYVNVGPGAIEGLKVMYPEIDMDQTTAVKLVHQLKDLSRVALPEDYPGAHLNLRDIEHCLCENRKYHYIKLKSKKARARPFKPNYSVE